MIKNLLILDMKGAKFNTQKILLFLKVFVTISNPTNNTYIKSSYNQERNWK